MPVLLFFATVYAEDTQSEDTQSVEKEKTQQAVNEEKQPGQKSVTPALKTETGEKAVAPTTEQISPEQNDADNVSQPDKLEQLQKKGEGFGPGVTRRRTERGQERDRVKMPVFRYLLSVGLVLALLGSGLYVLRRLRPRLMGSNMDFEIKVLNRVYVEPKTFLAIVQVRGQQMLVGGGGGQVRLIRDLQSSEEAEQPLEEAAAYDDSESHLISRKRTGHENEALTGDHQKEEQV